MLRLKRHPSDKISIVWRERTGPSKRLVARALTYSLLTHLLLATLFHIRVACTAQHDPFPAPTVFLDTEEHAASILSDVKNGDEDPRHRLTRELHLSPALFTDSLSAVRSSYAPCLMNGHSCPSQKREFLPLHPLPWSFSDAFSPSHHVSRVYPLKITLHQKLRSLELIEDGSSLFRRSSFETVLCTPSFSEIQPKVEFSVEVLLSTGAIIQTTCLRELTDKQLQRLAQHLVKRFRFRPSADNPQKTISGIISLQFAGTFDTMSNLLDTEQES